MSSVTNVEKAKSSGWFRWLPSPALPSMLLSVVVMLLIFSLVMVASASIPFAQSKGLNEFYFFYRQLMYIGVGAGLAFVLYRIPLRWIFRLENILIALAVCVIGIIMTLFGDPINGSRRWIELGGVNIQPTEVAKLLMVLFTADFVVRRDREVRNDWLGLARIILIVFALTILLIWQKDYGSLVIITFSVASIVFVAGLRKQEIAGLMGAILTACILGVLSEAYRLERVKSFLDPFDDMQDSDYQLAGSIVAFSRGELTGVGYGESLQKLARLPEAHTDFLLAITGEELGFFGVSFLILLQILLITVIMRISYVMMERRQLRLCYFAFGIGIFLFGQIFVNAGMTMGLLPTKGLTMPFFSYGGSAMLVCLMAIGILLRILKESPTIENQYCRYY